VLLSLSLSASEKTAKPKESVEEEPSFLKVEYDLTAACLKQVSFPLDS
jgi:hypothetical protein